MTFKTPEEIYQYMGQELINYVNTIPCVLIQKMYKKIYGTTVLGKLIINQLVEMEKDD